MVTKPLQRLSHIAWRGYHNHNRTPTKRSSPTPVGFPPVSHTPKVTFYWRPGCPFCRTLEAGLQREGIEYDAVDIWQHPDAAEFVRSVANGNETVPTVTVGDVAVVNPPVAKVLELLGR